jgi:hypothetical protein
MIDHIVLVVPDLAATCATLANDWGASIGVGGAHPRHGTHNALLRLGQRCYLEILAADPAVPAAQRSDRGKRVAAIDSPTLLEAIFAIASPTDRFLRGLPSHVTVESDAEGRRLRPDGAEVKWRLLGLTDATVGRLPDMIEWLSPHPSADLPEGAMLERFGLYHPQADMLAPTLIGLAGDDPLLTVMPGHGLAADIKLPKGVWRLTGL